MEPHVRSFRRGCGRVTVARLRRRCCGSAAACSARCSDAVQESARGRAANSPLRNVAGRHNGGVEAARTVLVVDDEPTVRDVVGQYLARDGFRVVTTGDGREVTALVERESPHLVVLDVMLPGIGGLELCRAIRARWPIPVILLTARGEETRPHRGPRARRRRLRDQAVLAARARGARARRAAARRRRGSRGAAAARRPRDRRARRARCVCAATRFAWPRASSTCSRSSPGTRAACSRASRSCRACGATRRPSTPGTLSVHVRRLREKIEDDPRTPRRIETVWNVGYRFVA